MAPAGKEGRGGAHEVGRGRAELSGREILTTVLPLCRKAEKLPLDALSAVPLKPARQARDRVQELPAQGGSRQGRKRRTRQKRRGGKGGTPSALEPSPASGLKRRRPNLTRHTESRSSYAWRGTCFHTWVQCLWRVLPCRT